MKSYDVLIVGGGPAGSTAARTLTQAGLRVLVIDKREFPRDKPCAGWITPQVVQSLALDLDAYRRDRVCQEIFGFRCGMIGGDVADVTYDQIISYGIRRCEFDTYLLHRSGAELQLGEPLRELSRQSGCWIVNDRYTAPLLVGAGGHFCPVARSLGARQGNAASVVAAQEIEFAMSDQQQADIDVAGELPELYFCQDLAGYGWCFRKQQYLNIGLGRLDNTKLSEHVAAFCDFLRQRGRICGDLPVRFAGHAYQLYERIVPRLCDDGVLLVGDAAGLAYPQSGEGIRPAVESGIMAAEVILQSGLSATRDDLSMYERRIEARFGKPRRDVLSGWLPASWLRFVASRLLASRWFARRVVMDRWFLHRDVPALEV